MASKLIRTLSHEAENQYELSLRQAFEALEPQLRPPFSLRIPNSSEYLQLNRAIVYGVLCEPHFAKIHVKHLHAIVIDGYALFVSLLVKVVNELYVKLVDSVKNQLIWVTKEMIDVSAVGFDGLLLCLLRQIVGGDFSDGNLWLGLELVRLFLDKWDCLLEEEPFILNSALYTFLRLLADHCRLSSIEKLGMLKRLEVEFCVKMLREQFHLCFKIGRDLVRLLQDLVHVPSFRAIWKDLLLNPNEFKTPGFSDISQLYHMRSSSRYFLTRITPEMETQLRFLLTHVKFGSQKRYQEWFTRKFLFGPERETLIVDIVRFICCGHHPSNEIIQSDVVPRWAVIGWLLKCCRKNYVQANVKLALFYDWLFFDERVDNIMNIEPAMLLMVCSIPRYIDMTNTLLDFLLLLVDNYDVDRNDIIVRGVKSAFGILVQKGVVHSLDVLASCKALPPFLQERLQKLQFGVPNELQPAHPSHRSVPTFSLPPSTPTPERLPTPTPILEERLPVSTATPESLPTPTPSPKRQHTGAGEVGLGTRYADASIPVSDDLVTPCSSSLITGETIEKLVQNLGETVENSNTMGLKTLDELLMLFVKLESQKPGSASICPEVLASKITVEFETNGCKLFTPLKNLQDAPDRDDEIGSATALIIRAFIFSQHERMQQMLLNWSKNGFPVGARLVSYASRLAYEACMVINVMVDNNICEINDSGMQLLIFHVDGYFSFLNGKKEDSSKSVESTSKIDEEFVIKLVDNAFTAYKCFLMHTRATLLKEADTSLSKLLLSDLISCSEWENKRLKSLFGSIFCHLADLSTSEENIIKLVVNQLDHADLVDMQLEVALKKYSLFGGNTEAVFHLIKNSLCWNHVEQHKFWGLIRSELAVSNVQLEKIILEFFCSHELDANIDAIAVGGLLALCGCYAPTPELVGVIMLLPNNVFQDFTAAALASWSLSNASMLFESLAKFLEKFDSKNGDRSMINHSAILWLLNHFKGQGMSGSNILSCLSVSMQG
ncbi:integrator complex subunit 3-like [Melia azedarach]|uniref:Integrator complex subunit 3-like n=1 Tax=Melia azedarach TaxID=155640 RepID=A0ACC1YLP0_MELAZ|nr:integrator complex subunit 3-like [Melia azedarach]